MDARIVLAVPELRQKIEEIESNLTFATTACQALLRSTDASVLLGCLDDAFAGFEAVSNVAAEARILAGLLTSYVQRQKERAS